MNFDITFHGPYRVASGHAGDGSDSVVDPDMPLPASSLKGVMKSAACELLALPDAWVKRVYGTAHWPSPWNWSDATPMLGDQPAPIRARARIQIDADTATVTRRALAIADEVLPDRAQFTITRTGWLPADEQLLHERILLACARAVTAIGGDRRRGLGWVSIQPTDPPWSTTAVGELVATLMNLPQRQEQP